MPEAVSYEASTNAFQLKEKIMKRTLALLSFGTLLAIAAMAQTPMAKAIACHNCCKGQCGQTCCKDGCTDNCCQSK